MEDEHRGLPQDEVVEKVLDELVEFFSNCSPEELEKYCGTSKRTVSTRPESISWWEISDKKWERVNRLLAKTERKSDTGRPRQNLRDVLSGILWYLGSPDTSWADMPVGFPPHQTCHRYYRRWKKNEVLEMIILITGFKAKREF